jgi:hypothetical protein
MMCPQEFSSPVYGSWPYNGIFYDYVKERDDGKEERAREKKETGRMNRTEKIGRAKKELKDDIIKYEQYLRKRLDFQLERLPINFENEGIEHLKMWYRNTIDKYPFLEGIIKEVCPKAFEPDNKELQSAIIHQQMQRDLGSEIIAGELKAIDFENAYNRKNRKKIPYQEYERRDPRMGKVIT